MRIPDRILNIVEKQLDADCGIGADRGNTVTTENKTVICRAPRFPEKRYLTDAAYGELLRERMEKESGNEPRVYEGQDLFSGESSAWDGCGSWPRRKSSAGA